MKTLPQARRHNILVQDAGKELLLYDLKTNKAYCLNKTSKIVFEACDGNTDFGEFKRKNNFTDDLIYFALDEFKRENLLDEIDNFISPLNGMTRREMIRKVGLATMVALPILTSITAPLAAHAASGLSNGACTTLCDPNSIAGTCLCLGALSCPPGTAKLISLDLGIALGVCVSAAVAASTYGIVNANALVGINLGVCVHLAGCIRI